MLNDSVILHLFGFANGLYLATGFLICFFAITYHLQNKPKTGYSLFLVSLAIFCLSTFSFYAQKAFSVASADTIPATVAYLGKYLPLIGIMILIYIISKFVSNSSIYSYILVKRHKNKQKIAYGLITLLLVFSFFSNQQFIHLNVVHYSMLISIWFVLTVFIEGQQKIPYSKSFIILFLLSAINSIYVLYIFNFNHYIVTPKFHLISHLLYGLTVVIFGFFMVRFSEMEYEKLQALTKSHEYDLALNLNEAILNNNLYLEYQPKLDLKENKINGLEALIRWQHPKKGKISPSEFIPIIEKSGLINDLCIWIIRQVVLQAAEFQRQKVMLPISINFSTDNLTLPTVNFLEEMLIAENVNANMIHIEITETIFLEIDTDRQLALDKLHAMNIALSMDDYGTGFSSLSYLQQLHLKELKIDATFIKDIANQKDHQVIVDSIIKMSSALNLKVTAEGVETKEVKQLLTEMGCDTIQGYYLTKPLSVPKLIMWIDNQHYHLPAMLH